MSTEINPITSQGPGWREVRLGLLCGLCGLIGVAIFLSFADPYLRDPAQSRKQFTAVLHDRLIVAPPNPRNDSSAYRCQSKPLKTSVAEP